MTASPFEYLPGREKFGEYEFEWLPLLKTPCYGYTGPNACYSTTCNHNPSLYLSGTQRYRSKYPHSAKIPIRLSTTTTTTQKSNKQQQQQQKSAIYGEMIPYNQPGFYAIDTTNSDQSDNGCRITYMPCEHEIPCVDCMDEMAPKVPTMNAPEEFFCSHCINRCNNTEAKVNGNPESMPIELMDIASKKHIFNPLSKPFDPKCAEQWEPIETNDTIRLKKSINSENGIPSILSDVNCDCMWKLWKTNMFGIDIDWHEAHKKILQKAKNQEKSNLENPKKLSFQCILCPQKFDTFKQLSKHYRNKVNKPYHCTACKASFDQQYLLWRHQNIHRDLAVLKCRGCQKQFRSFLSLKKHFDKCRHRFNALTENY